MDIEGFVRKRIDDYTYEDLTALLASRIREYKDLSEENSCKMAEAVIDEVKTTLELNSLDDDFLKEIVDIPKADVAMGKMGVGSRGAGDFFVHRKIAEIVSIRVIASGGAGTMEHFYDALTEGKADAALAASLFHYKELEIADLKDYLAGRGVPVRR